MVNVHVFNSSDRYEPQFQYTSKTEQPNNLHHTLTQWKFCKEHRWHVQKQADTSVCDSQTDRRQRTDTLSGLTYAGSTKAWATCPLNKWKYVVIDFEIMTNNYTFKQLSEQQQQLLNQGLDKT